MVQVRQSIFETNSSSTHCLTMCTESDFEKWKNGELIFDMCDECLIPITEQIKRLKAEDDCHDYMTWDDFNDWSWLEYETFKQTFETPNGDKVIGFGFYGYN